MCTGSTHLKKELLSYPILVGEVRWIRFIRISMVPIIFFFKYNIIIHNNSKFPIVLLVYFGIIIVINNNSMYSSQNSIFPQFNV